MSNGEIPYRDFGSPVGYGFWILPAIFFRIFGPYVYTLLVVQAFINICSGLLFRRLLRLFSLPAGVTFLALVVYCLSYSMFNFWPWYNHLVFVFELAGLFWLCTQIVKTPAERKAWVLLLSAFFIALSFMTKQDTGALGFFIALAFLIYAATLGLLEIYLRACDSARPATKVAAAIMVAGTTIVMGVGIFAATMGMWIPRIR